MGVHRHAKAQRTRSACCATERSIAITITITVTPAAPYSRYSPAAPSHTEHHRSVPSSSSTRKPPPAMQYYSNPQMNPAMQGGMGMGANQGMLGQNPMLGMNGMGMQGMGSYGQAWRNLVGWPVGRAACAGADGSGRAMTIPRRVLRTSPTPPGEPGTLYVSRFLFRPGWQLIHPPRPTPSTTVAASNEGSSITLCVSAVNMNLSSPSTVTHKTNVHSPTPRHRLPTFLVAVTHTHLPWSPRMTRPPNET